MSALDDSSHRLLALAHPDLARAITRAAEGCPLAFVVIETVRSLEKQKALYAAGASTTLRSRHLPNADGLACAADLAVRLDGRLRWDWPLYHILAASVKEAARMEDVAIEWGGDWEHFKDGPHFQLPWSIYP